MSPTEIKRIFNTIKYLRIKQIYYQIYYRFYKYLLQPKVSLRAELLRPWNKPWEAPLLSTPIISTSGEITVFNKIVRFDETLNWNDSESPKLYVYHLHYFNVLQSINTSLHVELLNEMIELWIRENPFNKGNGWEPYTLSLRIVNWIKWFSQQQEVKTEWLNSLDLQMSALLSKIEYHILGNHLFANAKALIFFGTYFSGSKADHCLQKGLSILDKELNEQFLEDGGHYELSPMYHAALLWDLCDLVTLTYCCPLPQLQDRLLQWQNLIKNSIKWLRLMCHPDGDISFFNDAAFGIAPSLAEIEHYVHQLNFIEETSAAIKDHALHWLKDSGYCIMELPNACKALLDVAKVGPDYQPGHAHADTLSFELSLYEQRFLVNSGTSTYEQGIQRQYERSTRAHNTVTINDKNSSDVWASFRVGQRAYPKNLVVDSMPEKTIISCEHDGYSQSQARCIHRREWIFLERELTVFDLIQGKNKTKAEAHFYFHPEVQIMPIEPEIIQCQLQDKQNVFIYITGAKEYFLEPVFWYPRFGTAVNTRCLKISFAKDSLITKIVW